MKVMISQPMNNIPDNKIKKIRKELIDKFAEMHIEVVDSFITDEAPKGTTRPNIYYLGRTIKEFLSDIDAVYFVDGWEMARGCRIEHAICQEYGIKCLFSDFFNYKNNNVNISYEKSDLTVVQPTGIKTIEQPFENIQGYGYTADYPQNILNSSEINNGHTINVPTSNDIITYHH